MYNAIELTKEQEGKLLEMCKALYPDNKWGFGSFYSSEVGATYVGLQYLDITHTNHVIPCVRSRCEIEGDSSNLEVVEKNDVYPKYDRVIDGFIDNIGNQKFFTEYEGKVKQGGDYDVVYVEGIHWFEFCVQTLVIDIMRLKTNIEDFGFDPWNFDKHHRKALIKMLKLDDPAHPVDYLYKHFKKLKSYEGL